MSTSTNMRLSLFLAFASAATVFTTSENSLLAQQKNPTSISQNDTIEVKQPEIPTAENNKERYDSKQKPVLVYLYSPRNLVSQVMRQQFQQLAQTRTDIDVIELNLEDLTNGKYYGHPIGDLYPDMNALIVHSSRALIDHSRKQTVARANEVNFAQLGPWVDKELLNFQPQIANTHPQSILENN